MSGILGYKGSSIWGIPTKNAKKYGLGKANIVTLLIHVVLVLIVVGVLLWLVNRYLPMASSIKSILNFVVIVAVILWLLKIFGIWNYSTFHI